MSKKYSLNEGKLRKYTYEAIENQTNVDHTDLKLIKIALAQYDIKCFGSITLVENIDDYFCFLKEYTKGNGDYVFRGISNKEQKYCKITRKNPGICSIGKMSKEQIDNIILKELEYIRKFTMQASFLNINKQSVTDLIAQAQHYSLTTRLIDWTASPIIATLFSLNSKLVLPKKEEGFYLLLATKKADHTLLFTLPLSENLNANGIDLEPYIKYGLMLKELLRVYFGKEDDKINYIKRSYTGSYTKVAICNSQDYKNSLCNFINGKIIFLETTFSNSRIVNQRGLFQIPVDLSKQYIDDLYEGIDLIIISKNIRENLVRVCKKLGFHYYSLMPDPQSIANIVNIGIDK